MFLYAKKYEYIQRCLCYKKSDLLRVTFDVQPKIYDDNLFMEYPQLWNVRSAVMINKR